jgi:hypothetical protein
MPLSVVDALTDLERALSGIDVAWYIFGAQAAIIHGAARVTADIDVTVDVAEKSTTQLVQAVVACGFTLRVEDDDDELIARTRVLPMVHEATSLPVDLVLAGPGLEELFFQRAERVEIGGHRFPVASAEDVVVMKILSGRSRDIEDVEAIMAAKGTTLDFPHIEGLLATLEEALDQSDLLSQLQRLRRRE